MIKKVISSLRQERLHAKRQVIHLEQVFNLFRIFERRFSDRPVHEQRDIIQDVVKRVTVSQAGISIQYFAGPPQDVIFEPW